MIRLWGHGSLRRDFMGKLVGHWQQGLARYQPGLPIDYKMYGTASAIGALWYLLSREGQADIVREGGYLLLSLESLLAQQRRLE